VAFEQSTINLISSYNSYNGEIKFSETNEVINNISVGDILYCPSCSKVEYGFLRKVVSVYSDKKTILTGQAFLEEVILKGNLHFEGRLTPSGKVKPLLTKEGDWDYDFEIPFEEIVIFDLDQNPSTTNDQIVANGFINFILELIVDADFDHGLDYFIFQTGIHESSNLKISSTFEIPDVYQEKSIFKVVLPRIVIGTILFIPIYAHPVIEIIVGADGAVNVSLIEINQDASLTAGLEYTGNWNFIKDFSNNFSYKAPQLEEDLNLKGFIGPRLSLIICDIAGPYGQVDAFLRLEAHNRDIGWELYGGIGARIGVNMGIFSKVVSSIQPFTLFEKETLLAQGNISINNPPVPIFFIDPSSGNTSTIFEFDASASYDQEDPQSLLKVRWDFDGNGIWDTDFSYTKTATHQYSESGNYYPKLEVKDEDGASDVAFKSLVVSSGGIPNTFTDPRDGKVYRIVQIGNQTWFAENINYEGVSGWCYDNDPFNCEIYGKLYDWNSAMNVCPSGWHLPSDDEWKILEGTVDSQYGVGDPEWDEDCLRGFDVGKKLKSVSGWNDNGNGTDDYGFTALPGGYNSVGQFILIGDLAKFWTSTQSSYDESWFREFHFMISTSYRLYGTGSLGNSVRCIKD